MPVSLRARVCLCVCVSFSLPPAVSLSCVQPSPLVSLSPPRVALTSLARAVQVFDGTSINIGDGKAYSKLKRCVRERSRPAPRAADG